MNKRELVEKLNRSFGLPRSRIEIIVDEVEAEIKCNEIAAKNRKGDDDNEQSNLDR